MKTFLFALLVATSAAAQPIVGPEVASPPLAAFDGAAIAPLRDGYVIAWSEQGRIRAGRLDATLHLTGTLLDLPLYESAGAARRPSVATTGTSVLVAWEETAPSFDGTIIASLSPDVVQLTNGPRLLAIARDDTPRVYAVNGAYSIVQGVVLYTVNESLDLVDLSSVPNATSVAVSPHGDVAFASVRQEVGSPCSGYGWGGWGVNCTTHTTIVFTTPGHVSVILEDTALSGASSPVPLPKNPVLAPYGDEFLATWRSPAAEAALIHGDGTVERWPFGAIEMPSVAGNGAYALAVWHASAVWSSATLFGTIRSSDGSTTPSFGIANGHDPLVFAGSANQFVLLYQIDTQSKETILAGRIIQLQSPKHRGTL